MNMKITKRVLIALITAAHISIPAWASSQDALTKAYKIRTDTLKSLKDLANKVSEDIKATEKKIKNSNEEDAIHLKNHIRKLQQAKSDLEEQIEDFHKWSSKSKNFDKEEPTKDKLEARTHKLDKELQKKAYETKKTAKNKLQELIPSKESIKENAGKLAKDTKEKSCQVKEAIKDKTNKIKKGSKSTFNKLVNGVKDGVKEGTHKVKDLFGKIGDKFTYKKSPKKYTIKESKSKDGSKYHLLITMPDFIKEQTDISINEVSKGNFVLNIRAKNDEAKKKIDDNPQSETMSKPIVIDEEKHALYYYDGELEATIRLPQNIKIDAYGMKFKNHILKIEFEYEEEVAGNHR